MKKFGKYAMICLFCLILFGLLIASVLTPDAEVSKAERRKLAQAPEVTLSAVRTGSYMEDLEEYFLDQFPLRDQFRTLKAVLRFDVFRQKDNNGIYLVDGVVGKLETELKDKQVIYAAQKMEQVISQYCQGLDVYYSVVPDKGYFLAEENGYPHLDYDAMLALMEQNVVSAQYIDIFPLLSIEDYYRTDTHWRQECIFPVAETLASAMGLDASLMPQEGFTEHTLSPFYGVYCGQSALPIAPDTLTYLTSTAIDAAGMTGVEFEGELPVYTTDRFDGMDGYDVFAGGAQAVLTIESPLAKTDRTLIIFRDSFSSSLAPLFLEGYSRVVLVDLRYIMADLIGDYVDFTNADVLFLYSTSLLNSGMLLK